MYGDQVSQPKKKQDQITKELSINMPSPYRIPRIGRKKRQTIFEYKTSMTTHIVRMS